MRKLSKILPVFLFLLTATGVKAQNRPLELWYQQPASKFEEALPLGNGRLGVMVYGKVNEELINLNEESLWGGGPTQLNPTPDAPSYLPKVREALFRDDWAQASRILKNIQGPNCQSFLPLGNLYIRQDFSKPCTDYRRSLDLNRALATTQFTIDGIHYTREIFVSAPAQVILIHLTASKTGALNFTVNADTPFEGCTLCSTAADEMTMTGQAPWQVNSDRKFPILYTGPEGQKGMRYQFRVKAITPDGIVTTTPALRVSKATEVTLIVSAATSFNGFDKRPDTEGCDEEALARNYLEAATKQSYIELQQEHEADYQHYFNRVSLALGSTDNLLQPTDQRLKAYSRGAKDPGLEALYFQFGRYLLISCSRPKGIPANLQGIWNINQRPSWGSNFTTNINLQMNYWPAEPLGLSELTEPLIRFIGQLSVTGSSIARNFYQMKGWTVHHNSDIWAHTNPVGNRKGDPKWANWALGSSWLSQHLYEHYRFSTNEAFLRDTAYPLMKGAAEFCKDWLVEKDGYLITAPSTSPENVFIDENGEKGVVTIASSMDMEIIWDLLNNLIEASEILKVDLKLRQEWTNMKNKLYPLRIGKNGNLIEWYKDWQDSDPQHRHVSHLFGLYPGRQISPLTTPEFAAACRKTLEIRGDGGTGWSKAWKINFWARLLDGNHAYKMYRELLSASTLPNLFDTHPPFQIDGNFGSIAGISEMLLQSQNEELHLLPALPDAWNQGEIKGLRARRGFEVNLKWQNSQVKTATILSKAGKICQIRTDNRIKVKKHKAKYTKQGDYYLTTFKTKVGESYVLESIK